MIFSPTEAVDLATPTLLSQDALPPQSYRAGLHCDLALLSAISGFRAISKMIPLSGQAYVYIYIYIRMYVYTYINIHLKNTYIYIYSRFVYTLDSAVILT